MSLSFVNNTLSLSSQELDYVLQFCFVTDKMSKNLELAYIATKERFEDATVVMTEEQCQNLPKENLKNDKKKTIFIFENFDLQNAAFKYIYTAETVHIFGIRSMLSILIGGIPSPAFVAFHLCNLAMKDMIIATTNLSKEEQKEVKNLVMFMGGAYLNDLRDNVTHLVSNSVRTLKYETAAQNNVKIMHVDWVKSVWKKSQNIEVIIQGDDPQFDTFKLPFFFNLCITSTGLKVPERNQIKNLVEENGGRYNSSYTTAIDILIMEKESVGSQKYAVALKLKKFCLSASWIHDSVKAGYAVPIDSYNLGSLAKASTPTKSSADLTKAFNPDNTQLSDISRINNAFNHQDVSLCETVATSSSSLYIRPGTSRMSLPSAVAGSSKLSLPATSSSSSAPSSIKKMLVDAKKVGSVLDGCNILLTGFSAAEFPIVSKIVSVLGATVMDTINEQITHIVVGVINSQLFADLHEANVSPYVLNLDWLEAIVEQKAMVDVDCYDIPRPETKRKEIPVVEKPSPASKKAMKSLSGVFKKPETPKFRMDNEKESEMDIVSQYLEPSTSSLNTEDSALTLFLTGKYVFIYGYSDTQAGAVIIDECERLGATLVDETFKKEVDYVITPPEVVGELEPPVKYKKLVSDIWVEESAEAGKCIEVLYYHKPILKLQMFERPLNDEIFVVTNYKGHGRIYVKKLVDNLGGCCKDIMKKTDNGILISPDDEGKKVESGKAWFWTVLTVEWLLECMTMKRRVNETPHLIGGTKPSPKNQTCSLRRSIVPSSQDVDDMYNPPIENIAENDSPITPLRPKAFQRVGSITPNTPTTPIFNVEQLVEGMPTPQRQDTLAVLLENQKKNAISPRQKRVQAIINTPATRLRMMTENIESPRPELPDCMKPTQVNYGIRPNSTPNSQAFHKRKLEGLDRNYREPLEKKQSLDVEEPETRVSFAHRRYDFYKSRLPTFNSPDPRKMHNPDEPIVETQCIIQCSAPRELDYEENPNAEPAVSTFADLEKYGRKPTKKIPPKPLFQQLLEEKPSEKELNREESEQMVEWADVPDLMSIPMRTSLPVQSNANILIENLHIFAFTGVLDKNKEEIMEKAKALGGAFDDEKFTILLAEKPNRGEKYMQAISRGCFVVHSDYIRKSHINGIFLDEDEFEFGNPKFNAGTFPNDAGFQAPYKWRNWIKNDYKERFADGAFTGKTFIIASYTKAAQFVGIIKTGGGQHVDVDLGETFKASVIKRQKVDICLYDTNVLSKENMEVLKQCNVKIHRLSYINEFLMQATLPE